mgnify:CR=1 FL=1
MTSTLFIMMGGNRMLLEIAKLKLSLALANFNGVILAIIPFIIIWILYRCFKDDGCGDPMWDYYNIGKYQNNISGLILLICALLTIVLVNPFYYMDSHMDSFMASVFNDLYEINAIGYLIMFSINSLGCRLLSVLYLGILDLLLYYLIGCKHKDYARYKFVNVFSIVILCLAIQICAYMLIPSNSFIFSNMLGWDL